MWWEMCCVHRNHGTAQQQEESAVVRLYDEDSRGVCFGSAPFWRTRAVYIDRRLFFAPKQ